MARDMENCHWSISKSINQFDENDDVLVLTEKMNDLMKKNGNESNSFNFTRDENDTLCQLAKNHLRKTTNIENTSLFLSLTDILYSYAYDHRTTSGDASPESAWTIAILSPTLSWFEVYDAQNDNPADALCYAMRRTLIYPYLRFWPLACMVADDVVDIFNGGKRVILRALLQIYRIFENTDTHYILNKIFICDYCVWIQNIPENEIRKFAQWIEKCRSIIGKDMIDLGLEDLESYVLEDGSDDDCK